MQSAEFLDYFAGLEDPRCDINLQHRIDEILFLTLSAVICGAEGWDDIELFGKSKERLLKEFFPYQYGIPSDDTLRRFFRALDPDKFQSCFIQWMQSLDIETEDKVICLDGKTSRRSYDHDKKALHTVSAFAAETRLVLGQQKTDEKSNEITAIPKLLELLDIQGSIITIDAMGTQREIANQIQDQGADYILALKGNQGTLNDDVRLLFKDNIALEKSESCKDVDGGHGRIETRKCTVIDDIEWLQKHHEWPGLQSIIKIDSSIESKGKTTFETRFYISSLPSDPQKISNAIRAHWAIENSLHWVLDVSFDDDQSRIRSENAPQNMMTIKHIALNLIRKIQTNRQSVKGLRKKAGWNDAALKSILSASKKTMREP